MSDGSPKVPAQASPPASATASYARIYEEQQPRLVAFARSLTRNNSWAAEDLVAEAHFRVWRRLSQGHEIENVPAYLMTTVRHLAATAVVGEARETPHDPRSGGRTEVSARAEEAADPAEQVSSVDLLVRVLGQLPERWVQALWLAEAEGQPLEAVGQRIGAKQGATAVLLHRAREGMRQAFLRSQTGAPDDPACEVHWVRMPAYVRGNATARQSERLLAHVDACDDCRGRLAVLIRANDRLPALVGPALLVFAVGGAGKFLLPLAAGSVGAAGVASAAGALSGQIGGALHAVRQAVAGGGAGAKVPVAVAAGATVAGAALAMMLALGTGGPATAPPSPRVPLAEAPVGARPSEGAAVEAPVTPGEGAGGRPVTVSEPVGEGESGVDVPVSVPVAPVPVEPVPTATVPPPVPTAPAEPPVPVPPVEPVPPAPPVPADPSVPNEPPVPPVPVDPGEGQPETPEYPEPPSTPGGPENPDTPDTPGAPGTPGTPGTPESPEPPGNPTNPPPDCGS
ncbi:sigma-70 family RNA polymerase sigma factor [Streptomyces chartreusis]|uniref:sigma-70 family RNA polymerase sigma factor n=1 Tax=Streptomyces chartreusis TaxID=1969 RepID=UPI003686BA2F